MGVHDLHWALPYSAMISSSNVRTKGVPVEVIFKWWWQWGGVLRWRERVSVRKTIDHAWNFDGRFTCIIFLDLPLEGFECIGVTLASDVLLVPIFHKHGGLICCNGVLHIRCCLRCERVIERLLTREEGRRENTGRWGHDIFHCWCNGSTKSSTKEEVGRSCSVKGEQLTLDFELVGFLLAETVNKRSS